MMIFWLMLFAVLVGGAMFVLGLCGRRISEHPHCRKCGFDLFGRDESSATCSECGADLRERKAITNRLRKRRHALLVPGLLILIASLFWSGWRLRNIDPTPYKPDWWLTRETRSADASTRVAAITELTRRMNNAELSESRLQALFYQALDVQADQTQTWLPEWGDFIQEAYATWKLSDAQWERYIRQAADQTLIARPLVRMGDPLPVVRVQKWSRRGRKPIQLFDHQASVRFVDRELPIAVGASSQIKAPRSYEYLFKSHIEDLPPGDHFVTVSATIYTSFANRDSPMFELASSANWTLLPADQPSVEFVEAPDLREQIQRAIKFYSLNQNPMELFDLNASSDAGRLALAYEMYVCEGEREWKVTGPVWNPNRQRTQFSRSFLRDRATGVSVKELRAETVDIVFRPNLELAAKTVDIMEVPSGEIAWREIPVKYRPQASNYGPLSEQFWDTALSEQLEPEAQWDQGAITRLFESAHVAGQMPSNKWERFLRQGLDFDLRVRRKIRQGDPLPFELRRDGHYVRLHKVKISGLLRATIDGQEVGQFQIKDFRIGHEDVIEGSILPHLAPGLHVLRITADLETSLANTPKTDLHLKWDAAFDVLPTDQSSVQLVQVDSALQSLVRVTLRVSVDGRLTILSNLERKLPPMAFDVILRSKGKEWPSGSAVIPESGMVFVLIVPMPKGFHPTFDVILKRSVSAAARTVDMSEIADWEIVLKDVPVSFETHE